MQCIIKCNQVRNALPTGSDYVQPSTLLSVACDNLLGLAKNYQ